MALGVDVRMSVGTSVALTGAHAEIRNIKNRKSLNDFKKILPDNSISTRD
jgi:hypothetical protein